MPDSTEIASGICEFIRKQIAGAGVVVEPGTSFEKLGLDSFSLIELILFLERHYGITLPDHELTRENMLNAGTLASCAVKYSSR